MDRPPNLDSCWLRRQNHLDLLLLRGSAASILTVVCSLQQHWDQEKSDANDQLILVCSQQESMQKGMHAKTGLTVHTWRDSLVPALANNIQCTRAYRNRRGRRRIGKPLVLVRPSPPPCAA